MFSFVHENCTHSQFTHWAVYLASVLLKTGHSNAVPCSQCSFPLGIQIWRFVCGLGFSATSKGDGGKSPCGFIINFDLWTVPGGCSAHALRAFILCIHKGMLHCISHVGVLCVYVMLAFCSCSMLCLLDDILCLHNGILWMNIGILHEQWHIVHEHWHVHEHCCDEYWHVVHAFWHSQFNVI